MKIHNTVISLAALALTVGVTGCEYYTNPETRQPTVIQGVREAEAAGEDDTVKGLEAKIDELQQQLANLPAAPAGGADEATLQQIQALNEQIEALKGQLQTAAVAEGSEETAKREVSGTPAGEPDEGDSGVPADNDDLNPCPANPGIQYSPVKSYWGGGIIDKDKDQIPDKVFYDGEMKVCDTLPPVQGKGAGDKEQAGPEPTYTYAPLLLPGNEKAPSYFIGYEQAPSAPCSLQCGEVLTNNTHLIKGLEVTLHNNSKALKQGDKTWQEPYNNLIDLTFQCGWLAKIGSSQPYYPAIPNSCGKSFYGDFTNNNVKGDYQLGPGFGAIGFKVFAWEGTGGIKGIQLVSAKLDFSDSANVVKQGNKLLSPWFGEVPNEEPGNLYNELDSIHQILCPDESVMTGATFNEGAPIDTSGYGMPENGLTGLIDIHCQKVNVQ